MAPGGGWSPETPRFWKAKKTAKTMATTAMAGMATRQGLKEDSGSGATGGGNSAPVVVAASTASGA